MSRASFAVLASILCLGLAVRATAKVPDPANSEVPDLITLVARGPDGAPDPRGTFSVVDRNFNRDPNEGDVVILDFSRCPDIRICADQGDPNVVVDCASHTIRAVTDVNGRATFCVMGCAVHQGSAGTIGHSLNVFAAGVFLGAVRVAALDQNGGGVNGDDASLFLEDYFSLRNYARSDYNGDGVVDGNDFSLWLAAFFAGSSAVSGGAACP